MKTTEHFKNTIEVYLRDRAETDELFAVSFSNPDKTMEQCITYILNCVKESGCCGFSDEEIYSLATHYWDEPDIEVGNPIDCNVVVNHTIELTAEEKEQARLRALKRVEDEAYKKIKQATTKKTPTNNQIIQPSLFDF